MRRDDGGTGMSRVNRATPRVSSTIRLRLGNWGSKLKARARQTAPAETAPVTHHLEGPAYPGHGVLTSIDQKALSQTPPPPGTPEWPAPPPPSAPPAPRPPQSAQRQLSNPAGGNAHQQKRFRLLARKTPHIPRNSCAKEVLNSGVEANRGRW